MSVFSATPPPTPDSSTPVPPKKKRSRSRKPPSAPRRSAATMRRRRQTRRSPATVIETDINYSFWLKKLILQGDGREEFVSCGTFKLVFSVAGRVLMFTFSTMNPNGKEDKSLSDVFIKLKFPQYKTNSNMECLTKVPQHFDPIHVENLKMSNIYVPKLVHCQAIRFTKDRLIFRRRYVDDVNNIAVSRARSLESAVIYAYVFDMPYLGKDIGFGSFHTCRLNHTQNILMYFFGNVLECTKGVKGRDGTEYAYHINDMKLSNTVCNGEIVTPIDLEDMVVWNKAETNENGLALLSQVKYSYNGNPALTEYVETYSYDIETLATIHKNNELQLACARLKSYRTFDLICPNVHVYNISWGAIAIHFSLLKVFLDVVMTFDRDNYFRYVYTIVDVLYKCDPNRHSAASDLNGVACNNFLTVLDALVRNKGNKVYVEWAGDAMPLKVMEHRYEYHSSYLLLFIINNLCSARIADDESDSEDEGANAKADAKADAKVNDQGELFYFRRPTLQDGIQLWNNMIILDYELMQKIHVALCEVADVNLRPNKFSKQVRLRF